mmetsp:Transcript_5850/g.7225  ORF Transcript_5850/g.7225 Transcript_5850/m.7225 type:complete len:290 (-) Transcript_5850:73-942(-)|eukprot:CAMPEP_0185770424 /NCGR_PEP_ID=MMETSP1174-20130828/59056_1 /TAXON_ID=35687 /ORGANISM="Dictyocha speculum, Strain CCMP1381" /LENGTH=289 /DNA_ID=CAMNT_0028455847 /DNA_START=1 /DNA_END=870 /DNA_ORIENTATION=-
MAELRLTPSDLRIIVCGHADDGQSDFDFREVFQVVTDCELQSCSELREALWETIEGLGVHDKRELLRFVTGVNKLPAPDTECMSIEMPFLPIGLDDHRKILHMVPQSHTCDNILELPNYWDALVRTTLADKGQHPDNVSAISSDLWTQLRAELRTILRAKLQVAIENAHGYQLDTLEETPRLDQDLLDRPDSPVLHLPVAGMDDEAGEDSTSSMNIPSLRSMNFSSEENKASARSHETDYDQQPIRGQRITTPNQNSSELDEDDEYSEEDYGEEEFELDEAEISALSGF